MSNRREPQILRKSCPYCEDNSGHDIHDWSGIGGCAHGTEIWGAYQDPDSPVMVRLPDNTLTRAEIIWWNSIGEPFFRLADGTERYIPRSWMCAWYAFADNSEQAELLRREM